eukprot:tig00020510_g9931.t1
MRAATTTQHARLLQTYAGGVLASRKRALALIGRFEHLSIFADRRLVYIFRQGGNVVCILPRALASEPRAHVFFLEHVDAAQVPQLELLHLLNDDIVGYGRLPGSDQSALRGDGRPQPGSRVVVVKVPHGFPTNKLMYVVFTDAAGFVGGYLARAMTKMNEAHFVPIGPAAEALVAASVATPLPPFLVALVDVAVAAALAPLAGEDPDSIDLEEILSSPMEPSDATTTPASATSASDSDSDIAPPQEDSVMNGGSDLSPLSDDELLDENSRLEEVIGVGEVPVQDDAAWDLFNHVTGLPAHLLGDVDANWAASALCNDAEEGAPTGAAAAPPSLGEDNDMATQV